VTAQDQFISQPLSTSNLRFGKLVFIIGHPQSFGIGAYLSLGPESSKPTLDLRPGLGGPADAGNRVPTQARWGRGSVGLGKTGST